MVAFWDDMGYVSVRGFHVSTAVDRMVRYLDGHIDEPRRGRLYVKELLPLIVAFREAMDSIPDDHPTAIDVERT